MACSICHHEGHNRSTCPQNPEIMAERAERLKRAEAELEAARRSADQELARQLLAQDKEKGRQWMAAGQSIATEEEWRAHRARGEAEAAAFRRQNRKWSCLAGAGLVLGIGALPVLFCSRCRSSKEPTTIDVTSLAPASSESVSPRPAPSPPRPQPRHSRDAGHAPYDENGLVDGGIPGAQAGWKPLSLHDAGASEAGR